MIMKASIAGLSTQIKDRLIQQSLERRLARAAGTEHPTQRTALEAPNSAPSGPVSEDLYRFDRHPGIKQIRIIQSGGERIGLANPFFHMHEGVASAHTRINGKELINFSSYNYLDFSGDPRVNAAAIDAIQRYGTSVSASRLVSGERPIHRDLETAIAHLYGTQDAIVFVSGHATNVSTIGQLFGPRDLVIHDEYIHNSVLQGIQLSGAKRLSFAHNDWRSLDALLAQQRSHFERVLIVLEGVYSMDGDYPDLPKFVEIRNRHRVFLMVDEAHSLGVMGATGHGIREHFGLASTDVDIWMGTLSKALAGCGGYIAGESALVDHLKYLAPGFLYSVGMSPPLAAASLAALKCLDDERDRVLTLQDRGQRFLSLAKSVGINTGTCAGFAVVPAIIGSSIRATRLASRMLDHGINVQPILYPAVPEKSARLRFFMSCRHTDEEIRYTVTALAKESGNI